MKFMHLCKVKLLAGVRSEEEVVHGDKKTIALRLGQRATQRLLYNGVLSIHELGWQRAYILRCR